MEHSDYFEKQRIGYGKWPKVTTTEKSVKCLQNREALEMSWTFLFIATDVNRRYLASSHFHSNQKSSAFDVCGNEQYLARLTISVICVRFVCPLTNISQIF